MADSIALQPESKSSSGRLSALQLELLKLYSTDVSSQELFEVKLLLGRYFGSKATREASAL